jgi:hypothetical protein
MHMSILHVLSVGGMFVMHLGIFSILCVELGYTHIYIYIERETHTHTYIERERDRGRKSVTQCQQSVLQFNCTLIVRGV